ncbi:hypothetical protein [Flavobacterium luteum]|uniref:Signal peptidase n=1 Tax=Flavobacterium luteum TaxID=2026654 RepID=A0A7J5AG62_9FLAO|nr:hypothetical protein [Flavobacterium luteum]KAB1156525.1 hypothetical protein F6464_03985 [Flavobacterium luteum]
MKNNFFKLFILSFFLLTDIMLFAQGQDQPGGGLEGSDPPSAQINAKLIWLGIVAILFAFYSYKRRLSKI